MKKQVTWIEFLIFMFATFTSGWIVSFMTFSGANVPWFGILLFIFQIGAAFILGFSMANKIGLFREKS